MAKKKRKKRPPQRPAQRAAQRAATAEEVRPPGDRPASARAEKKEQARRDRERRIKLARRRQRMRRATRWGAVLGVAGAITAVVLVQINQGNELEEAAQQAAERFGCTPVETQQDEVDAAAALDQPTLHSPPFAEGQNGVPVTAGPHSSPLQGPPFVFDQPIPEANAVHNLEHGYVIMYYAEEGQNALAEDIRSELEDLVNDESEKVFLAPYPDLQPSLAVLAWGNLQTCDPPADADPEDAVTVARSFIEEYRSGGLAPEPAGA